MKLTNGEYKEYSDAHMPRSRTIRNMGRAFWVGGSICCIGQLLSGLYSVWGLNETSCANAVVITLVFLGAALTGLGIYDRIAKYAGGGTLIPITGFANAVAAPALEFKTEGLVTGTAAKLFIIAGPVIVYGIGASVIYGIVLCMTGV